MIIEIILALLISVPALLVMGLFIWTPAFTFLECKLKNVPAYFDVENRRFTRPYKIAAGMEYFKVNREEVVDVHEPIKTVKTKYGEFGLFYPSNSTTVSPEAPAEAAKIAELGIKDMTEAQLAYAISQFKKLYPEIDTKKLLSDNDVYYDVTDSYGQVQRLSGLQFLMGEIEEMGVYPYAIIPRDIKNVIAEGKDTKASKLRNPLYLMANYLGTETRPGAYKNWVNEEVLQAKTETMLGKLKQQFGNYAIIAIILIAAAIAFFIFQNGGGINAVMGTPKPAPSVVQMFAPVLLCPKKKYL